MIPRFTSYKQKKLTFLYNFFTCKHICRMINCNQMWQNDIFPQNLWSREKIANSLFFVYSILQLFPLQHLASKYNSLSVSLDRQKKREIIVIFFFIFIALYYTLRRSLIRAIRVINRGDKYLRAIIKTTARKKSTLHVRDDTRYSEKRKERMRENWNIGVIIFFIFFFFELYYRCRGDICPKVNSRNSIDLSYWLFF